MYKLEWLLESASKVQVCVNGKYVPARPISGTFLFERLRDAWEVWLGHADSFMWPPQAGGGV